LYAAAISLGLQMKDTGGAQWVVENFLNMLAPLGADHGFGLWAAVSALTTAVTNTMFNGAAVAVLGPIVLKAAVVAEGKPDHHRLCDRHIVLICLSDGGRDAGLYDCLRIRVFEGFRLPKSGWKMAIASTVIMLVAAKLYWPLLGV